MPIPVIKVPLPSGWVVNAAMRKWTATSPSEYLYISITQRQNKYTSGLYLSNGNKILLEIQSRNEHEVHEAVDRLVHLAVATEAPTR